MYAHGIENAILLDKIIIIFGLRFYRWRARHFQTRGGIYYINIFISPVSRAIG